MFAFGATAALAVTLNRPVPAPAALTVAARPRPAPTCASAGLAVSLARAAGAFGSRYHVDFTNTSGSACTLSGYPQVAAYAVGRSGYAQVGNEALREAPGGASRVLLHPGGTAHWDVDVSAVAPDVACRPVTAAGLRVVPPGASRPRYLRARLAACSATGPDTRVYLRVRAIQPGTGSAADPAARGRHGRGARPARGMTGRVSRPS
jgi:hypothetical protein